MESTDIRRATREKLVLALIPIASRHSLSEPQYIVDIATALCKYIDQMEESGKPQDANATSGDTGRKPASAKK